MIYATYAILGDRDCTQKDGWQCGNDNWVPYTMLSNNDGTVWILLYHPPGDRVNQELQRLYRARERADWGIPGHNVSFKLRLYNDGFSTPPTGCTVSPSLCGLGNRWSTKIYTYAIIGQTMDSVMKELHCISGGAYPLMTGTCPQFPPCAQ